MLVGSDHAGNLLEIGVVTSEDGPVIATPCQLGSSTKGDADASHRL
jgi:hypothetical protein